MKKMFTRLIVALLVVVTIIGAESIGAFAAIPNSQNVCDATYTFKNVSTGKMMNTYAGKTDNGTKVTLWDWDGTGDQRYIVSNLGSGKIKLFFNSSGKAVDVYRGNAALKAGQIIDIWQANDNTAQIMYAERQSDASYIFRMASNTNLAIGITANGNGKQLQLVSYNAADKGQRWYFCNTSGNVIDPTYKAPAPVPSVKTSYVWPTSGYHIVVLDYYYGSKTVSRNKGLSVPHPTKGNGSVNGAIDIGVAAGSNVYASAGGTVFEVVKSTAKSGWGTTVTLKHDDGTYSFYAHLSSVSVLKGARVSAGQTIARSGNTGNSTGAHLHFEIWDSNKNTLYAFNLLKDRYRDKMVIDADTVYGGDNPQSTRNWISSNMTRRGEYYYAK